MQCKASNAHDSEPRGVVATVAPKGPRTAVAELRDELIAHLRDFDLAFVSDGDRQFLDIPGHHPIAFAPVPVQATGTHFYEETTTLVLNYPKPLVAVLPVALAVSIVRFSGTLSVSFIPSSPSTPSNPSNPANPSASSSAPPAAGAAC